MTDAWIEELRAGLEGLPDGPWEVVYGESGGGPDSHAYALLRCVEDESYTGIETSEVDPIEGSRIMKHLARCSPDNIRALLSRLDAVEARVTELGEASPDDIRVQGWSVAVHNDYRLNGEPHTFWLFTKGNRCIKGEGRTDAEALNIVRITLSAPKAETRVERQEKALVKAEQFIVNGVELGYIRMPDYGDPALDTLPAIRAVLAEPSPLEPNNGNS